MLQHLWRRLVTGLVLHANDEAVHLYFVQQPSDSLLVTLDLPELAVDSFLLSLLLPELAVDSFLLSVVSLHLAPFLDVQLSFFGFAMK